MKTRKPMKFEEVPSWAIDATEHSRYTIAAAFALAELTDKWVRLTADKQRELFGTVLFGKCNVKVNNDGIKVYRSVCFGTDFSCITMNWDEVEHHIVSRTKPCI